MVDAYFASPKLADLKPSTKREYVRYLREFQAELGEMHPDDLQPHMLARLRDNMADTPAKANSTIKAIGALYRWARETGWATQANPASGLSKLKIGEHQPWPPEALASFPRDLSWCLARACAFGLATGQRLGDVLAMHKRDLRGNAIFVRQQKTGKELLIPLHSAIRDLVLAADGWLCPKLTGGPFTVDQFHASWGRMRAKLPKDHALRDVVFHGLRKNATVLLLEAGCSEAEVASITGMSLAMVVHYGKGARQQVLAREAMRKLELYPGTAESQPSD